MRILLLAVLLLLSCPSRAEEDGDEFLALMSQPATRDVALEHIDDVRHRMDGALFCVAKNNPAPPADPQSASFSAVKAYLEAHPAERYRPRRYLILQGLRAAFPCAPR